MKIKYINLIAAVVILVISAVSANAESSTLRRQVEKLYRTAEHLFATKNADGLNAVIAPDFKGDGPMGETLNHDGMVDETNQMFKQMKTVKAKFTVLHVKKVGENIVVDTKYSFSTVMMPDKSGKTHKMVMKGTSKETWLHKSGKWWMKSYKEGKNSTMLMDGKPMDMSKMKPPTKTDPKE